jgi:hypothetical protein
MKRRRDLSRIVGYMVIRRERSFYYQCNLMIKKLSAQG